MKKINQFIQEKLRINKDTQNQYNYFPKDTEELKDIVLELINKRGNEADLNDIDVSKVEDMYELFHSNYYTKQFNGDISNWDVSNVKCMDGMFSYSKFNGDISKWDVRNVEYMHKMFENSKFNGDISKWDVSNVKDMGFMFINSKFNGNISKWDVSNVKDMHNMFLLSKFNGDISNWDVSNVKDMIGIFSDCPLEKNPPKWYQQ